MESPWSIESIPAQASQVDMLEMLERDGVVILEDLLTEGQVAGPKAELDSHLERLETGGMPMTGDPFGSRSKRFSNLPTTSKTFRKEVLEHDVLLGLVDEMLQPDADLVDGLSSVVHRRSEHGDGLEVDHYQPPTAHARTGEGASRRTQPGER